MYGVLAEGCCGSHGKREHCESSSAALAPGGRGRKLGLGAVRATAEASLTSHPTHTSIQKTPRTPHEHLDAMTLCGAQGSAAIA